MLDQVELNLGRIEFSWGGKHKPITMTFVWESGYIVMYVTPNKENGYNGSRLSQRILQDEFMSYEARSHWKLISSNMGFILFEKGFVPKSNRRDKQNVVVWIGCRSIKPKHYIRCVPLGSQNLIQ